MALADIARRHGITHLTAEVLTGNAPMLAVFRRCGLPLRLQRSGDVLRLSLELGPPAS